MNSSAEKQQLLSSNFQACLAKNKKGRIYEVMCMILSCQLQTFALCKREQVEVLVAFNSLQPHGLQPTRLLSLWNSLGRNTGVGSHSLIKGILLTQGSNLGLLHCRQILYYLSHLSTVYRMLTFTECMLCAKCMYIYYTYTSSSSSHLISQKRKAERD